MQCYSSKLSLSNNTIHVQATPLNRFLNLSQFNHSAILHVTYRKKEKEKKCDVPNDIKRGSEGSVTQLIIHFVSQFQPHYPSLVRPGVGLHPHFSTLWQSRGHNPALASGSYCRLHFLHPKTHLNLWSNRYEAQKDSVWTVIDRFCYCT